MSTSPKSERVICWKLDSDTEKERLEWQASLELQPSSFLPGGRVTLRAPQC
ncbi:hypothetical protein BIW11_03993 [Tropilaelaps mercedesae]|uniref:Uncharacterized protein n=1 Tax=Tropilaelaps mercedesae TaxID=418985 RepID=A0A1V9XD38_9ACAR|nr:hypothetical protein BIW11_03993 [Tropilaelaps mercedesae]